MTSFFASLWQSWRSREQRRAKRGAQQATYKPRLEWLEDRLVPSTASTAWANGVTPTTGGSGTAAVAVDNSGNVYIAGKYSDAGAVTGAVTNFGSTDNSSVTLPNNLDSGNVFVAKYSPAGVCQWAVSPPELNSANDDAAVSLIVTPDPSNPSHEFVYAAGYTSNNGFAAKLDGDNGALSWKSYVTGKTGRGVAVDASGNAYSTFANDYGFNLLTAAGSAAGDSGNVIKFDSTTGNQVWNYQIAGPAKQSPPRSAGASTFGVAVAGSNVYVTGRYIGKNVNFNPAGTNNLSSTYGSGYDLKLTTSGAFVWVSSFDGSSGSLIYPYAIAVDAAGSVYTGGDFAGSVDFDPSAATQTLNGGSGNGSAFITKLDNSGKLKWAEQLHGAQAPFTAGALTLDNQGNVYLTGSFTGTVNFNPGAGSASNLTSQGEADIFVVKLDSSGALVWAVDAGGPRDDRGNEVAVDGSGNVYVAGTINRDPVSNYNADFDPFNSYADNHDLLTVNAKSGFLWKLTQS